MLLFNNTSVGGAERRYAWVYHALRRRNVPIMLAIMNRCPETRLWDLSNRNAGLLDGPWVESRLSSGNSTMSWVAAVTVGLARLRRFPSGSGGAYLAYQSLSVLRRVRLSLSAKSSRDGGFDTGLYLYRVALRLGQRVTH